MQLEIRTGSLSDYARLAEHHYRAHRPATATRVLTLHHHGPTVLSRFHHMHAQSANSESFGNAFGGTLVGVLVESLPALSCRLREEALDGRYGSISDPRQRARLLNQEVRCISRVIVHPQYRGLGAAVRLVQHALATAATIYTEALAVMGHVHPFFARAGMTAYERPPHRHDARLRDALIRAGFTLEQLADVDHLARRLRAWEVGRRTWLEEELRRWHRQQTRLKSEAANLEALLALARARLWCAPVYYLRQNDRRA